MAKLLVCYGAKCVEMDAELACMLDATLLDYTAKVVATSGMLPRFELLESVGLVRRESEMFVGEEFHTVWFAVTVQGVEALDRWQEMVKCGCV